MFIVNKNEGSSKWKGNSKSIGCSNIRPNTWGFAKVVSAKIGVLLDFDVFTHWFSIEWEEKAFLSIQHYHYTTRRVS